ncbi:MAG: class I SAM-dependent methyltransferase [Clostridiales bacterium]|nr:class I SAM-dependent methyltransferase [Clostridiales bacterium]
MPVIKGLGWTFNTQAERYERMRPGYVPELYEEIFRHVPLNAASTAVEVGIGGGQATEPILRTGCRVIAVESGDQLAELCRHKFRHYPNFEAVTCKFEDFPEQPDSCDLIFSASAFHWIPEETGYPKVFRMLRPGGVFARFANHPFKDKGRPGMHEALQEIYAVYMPGSLASDEYTQAQAAQRALIAEKYGFVDISHHLYHRTRDFTAAQYVELLGTYSDHIAIEENTRRRFFAEIEAVIDRLGGVITLYDTIDLQLARKP